MREEPLIPLNDPSCKFICNADGESFYLAIHNNVPTIVRLLPGFSGSDWLRAYGYRGYLPVKEIISNPDYSDEFFPKLERYKLAVKMAERWLALS
jgi:hypothetical protein